METPTQQQTRRASVHRLLAQSYFTFFVFILCASWLASIYSYPIASDNVQLIGMLVMTIGTIFILWAQGVTRQSAQKRLDTAQTPMERFANGPYKYLRSPTHVGLVLLGIGYAFMINSLIVVIVALIFAIVGKIVFISAEEKILLERYGDAYREYLKKVKF